MEKYILGTIAFFNHSFDKSWIYGVIVLLLHIQLVAQQSVPLGDSLKPRSLPANNHQGATSSGNIIQPQRTNSFYGTSQRAEYSTANTEYYSYSTPLSPRMQLYKDSIMKAQDSLLWLLDIKDSAVPGMSVTHRGFLESEGGFYEAGAGEIGKEERNLPPTYNRLMTILFYIFLIIFLLLGYLKYLFPHYFKTQFYTIQNINLARQYYEQNLTGFSLPTLLSTTSFVLLIAAIILAGNYFLKFVPVENFSLLGLEIILPAVIIAVALRFLMLRLATYIVPDEGLIKFYMDHHFSYMLLATCLLLPLASFFCFYGIIPRLWLLLILFAIVMGLFLLLLLRGLSIMYSIWMNNKFYFFIYLCGVEFLPMLLVAKYCVQFTIK